MKQPAAKTCPQCEETYVGILIRSMFPMGSTLCSTCKRMNKKRAYFARRAEERARPPEPRWTFDDWSRAGAVCMTEEV